MCGGDKEERGWSRLAGKSVCLGVGRVTAGATQMNFLGRAHFNNFSLLVRRSTKVKKLGITLENWVS